MELSHDNGREAYLPSHQARKLFLSHVLSTWNARTYEFAAILFTAAAFPETLLAASLRGIVSSLASITFSSTIGTWIDRAPSRLRSLTTTIFLNRCSVIVACVGWLLLLPPRDHDTQASGSALQDPLYQNTAWRIAIFAATVSFGIIEKLSATGNMLCMERDWVPALVPSGALPTDSSSYNLTSMNVAMRRIDLICKLFAPFPVSLLISFTGSHLSGVLLVAGMSFLSVGLEIWSAYNVWESNASLRAPKGQGGEASGTAETETTQPFVDLDERASIIQRLGTLFQSISYPAHSLRTYFQQDVWIPSFALSLLYFNSLSYGATFITFMLTQGCSITLITIARAFGSIVEVSSTLLAPFGITHLSQVTSRQRGFEEEEDHDTGEAADLLREEGRIPDSRAGLERCGLWGVSWMLINLIPAAIAVWVLAVFSIPLPPRATAIVTRFPAILSALPPQPLLILSLFFFLSTSRLGLWSYDLTTQELTQMRVPAHLRSSFAGIEVSLSSFFELAQWSAAAVLNRPEQFRWSALSGCAAVAMSTAMYACWVWKQRGHLFHFERVTGKCGC